MKAQRDVKILPEPDTISIILALKDPDTDPNDIKHHTGVYLMNTYKGASGLNLRNCVLLNSDFTVHAFCNENGLQSV